MDTENVIRQLEAKILVAKAVMVLKHSPGWAEFVKQVKGLKDIAFEAVLDPDHPARDHAAGFCLGLASVVDTMDDVEQQLLRAEQSLQRLRQQENFRQRDPLGSPR